MWDGEYAIGGVRGFPVTEKSHRCGICTYWKMLESGRSNGPESPGGECQKNPPTALVIGSEIKTVWPRTGETDACGAFVPKNPRPRIARLPDHLLRQIVAGNATVPAIKGSSRPSFGPDGGSSEEDPSRTK